MSITETVNRISPHVGHRDEATEDPDEKSNKLEIFQVSEVHIRSFVSTGSIFYGDTKDFHHYSVFSI